MTREYNYNNTQPTNTGMSYSQAKDIRKKSLASLLTDELMKEDSTIGGSIKSALSDKTKATMKGIKQRIDPMNIVKFMTGGSTLASTMFGKMSGRNEEDMRFFAGKDKATPVGSKATKVGAVEGGSDEGLIAVLSQIYSLLKSTHENEVTKRELENNKAEEKQSEDERRHKELLKALGAVSNGGGTVTVVKEKDSGGGLFDFLTSIVEKWFGMKVSDIAGIIGKITTVATFLAPVLSLGATILAPAVIGGLLGMKFKGYQDEREKENQAKYDQQTQDNTLKQDIVEVAKLPDNPIKPSDVNKQQEYANLFELRIQKKQKFTPEESEILKKKLSVYVPKELITSEAAPAAPPAKSNGVSAPAPVPPTPTATQTPTTPVPSTPPSAKVTSATNENNDLQLKEKTQTTSTTDVQKQKTVNVEMEQRAYRGSMPSVRNSEMTFQRMIFNSTRVS